MKVLIKTSPTTSSVPPLTAVASAPTSFVTPSIVAPNPPTFHSNPGVPTSSSLGGFSPPIERTASSEGGIKIGNRVAASHPAIRSKISLTTAPLSEEKKKEITTFLLELGPPPYLSGNKTNSSHSYRSECVSLILARSSFLSLSAPFLFLFSLDSFLLISVITGSRQVDLRDIERDSFLGNHDNSMSSVDAEISNLEKAGFLYLGPETMKGLPVLYIIVNRFKWEYLANIDVLISFIHKVMTAVGDKRYVVVVDMSWSGISKELKLEVYHQISNLGNIFDYRYPFYPPLLSPLSDCLTVLSCFEPKG